MTYLTLYLLFQLVYSLFFYFVIFNPLASVATQQAAITFQPHIAYLPVLVISIFFVVIRVVIDCYIGWRWMKMASMLPKFLHWGLSYLVFLGAVGINMIWGFLMNPYLYNLRSFPVMIFVLSGLDLFMVFVLLQLTGAILLLSFGSFELYIILSLVFIWSVFIITHILPISLFYVGVKIAGGRSPLNESSSED
ncbi:MAG: hypothetical protein ACFFDI_09860 [Promethearchaeota archaeon]